jgi:hypothetical protein
MADTSPPQLLARLCASDATLVNHELPCSVKLEYAELSEAGGVMVLDASHIVVSDSSIWLVAVM